MNSLHPRSHLFICASIVLTSSLSTLFLVNRYRQKCKLEQLLCPNLVDVDVKEELTLFADTTPLETTRLTAPDAQTTPKTTHAAIKQWVHNILRTAATSVIQAIHNTKYIDAILSQSPDATAVLLSRDSWFIELSTYVRHTITCVNVRVPFTIRLSEKYNNRCIMLDAYSEYEVRYQPRSISYTIDDNPNTHVYKQQQESYVIRDIRTNSMNHQVMKTVNLRCTINCDIIDDTSLSEMLGVPIASDIVSKMTTDMLSPSNWDHTSLPEWFHCIYSRCAYTTHTSPQLSTDRIVHMLQTNAEADAEDAEDAEDADTPIYNILQSKTRVIVGVVLDDVSDTHKYQLVTDAIRCIAESYQSASDFYENAFYIITDETSVPSLTTDLHTTRCGTEMYQLHLKTFVMGIQTETEHQLKTHVTHIEIAE